jgi:hypothetical protein
MAESKILSKLVVPLFGFDNPLAHTTASPI